MATDNRNTAMSQSEFKAITCNRRPERENACERGTIGWEGGASLDNQLVWQRVLK